MGKEGTEGSTPALGLGTGSVLWLPGLSPSLLSSAVLVLGLIGCSGKWLNMKEKPRFL